MSDPVAHFEIPWVPTALCSCSSTRQPFGWLLRDGQLPGWPVYGLLRAGETGIGGMGTADAANGAAVVVYVEVDDPATYLQRAEELGARVVMPATHVAEAEVTVGWLRDLQGNIVRRRQEARGGRMTITVARRAQVGHW